MARTPATPVKYIFVTGGVVSSLGKGIVSASLAKLLQARGYAVTIQKLDPYFNVDPGTLNPYEHGEVYVTDDGAETDLDLGHYERYLNTPTSQANNVTAGRIYQTVIQNERLGAYEGKTVQVVPHITDEIKRRIRLLGETGQFDVVITEIGGTVGDIESLPFIEAIRQMRYELARHDSLVIHLTLIPWLPATQELKTKPTQFSVKQLLESGVQPDVIVCRTQHKIPKDVKGKIAQFCNVEAGSVIEARDADTIYEVPLLLKREQFDRVALNKLLLPLGEEPELTEWREFLRRLRNPVDEVRIGLVGKYAELADAYKSILEAFIHAGAAHETRVEVELIHSEDVSEENAARRLHALDGLVVAPGFGERGIAGKVAAVQFARTQGVPFLGICLGMQVAVIEYGRHILGLSECNSLEFDAETPDPVINLMESQAGVQERGGTMRLGGWPCRLTPGSLAAQIYGREHIRERHRHRYEFNNAYRERYAAAGMVFSGVTPEADLVEIIELPAHAHPFFIACQFHPEYRSAAAAPHPLFTHMVQAALEYKKRPVEA